VLGFESLTHTGVPFEVAPHHCRPK
jgi:hypothetical protein